MFSHPAMRAANLAPMLLLAGLLTGCAGGGDNPDGIWVGRLQTVAGQCAEGGDSDLTVSERAVTFVPGDGVISLRGLRDAAHPDALHAQFLGHDMNHKLLPMVFDGRVADGAVTGTLGTPTCRATITMHRPTDTGMQRLLGN